MEINIRHTCIGPFVEVSVSDGNATIELGLLNDDESKELAETLITAAYDLGPTNYGEKTLNWFLNRVAECEIELPNTGNE